MTTTRLGAVGLALALGAAVAGAAHASRGTAPPSRARALQARPAPRPTEAAAVASAATSADPGPAAWLRGGPVASTPNDPEYDPAEKPSASCAQASVNDEQTYLYSFLPRCAPNARDPEGASGMSVDAAWHRYTTGDPHTVIAYVEGGINWHLGDIADLVNKVHLNIGELPVPCTGLPCVTRHSANEADYDVDHDGVVNAADYAHDPRVHDVNHNGVIDPEDITVAFSCYDAATSSIGTPSWPSGRLHCSNGAENVDNDHNGYPHDISGWDFYDNQNDPATLDSSYDHANGQMRQAAAQADNGFAGAGVCPACQILPVKAGAEALDRTEELAQAWEYAADAGASVVVSVTADLGYSSFMRQVVEDLWRRGVVMVQASNDFDSIDHQGGMFWPHVLPGNGLVSDTQLQPGNAAAFNNVTTTYRARSAYTSWGPHAMFSVATRGGTTSESTPTVGGVMGLVLAYGRQAAAAGLIGAPLTGPEAVQVVRATASPVTDPTLPWPGSPGEWNPQYGYGRPNLARAMAAIARDDVPPLAEIDSPDWYAFLDPTVTRSVTVSGSVAAPRGPNHGQLRWVLQAAPGENPAESAWTTIGTGTADASHRGVLGTLDLGTIRTGAWEAAARISSDKELSSADAYDVTLRLRVYDDAGRLGEDRRTVAAHHDPTLLPGFPLRIGTGHASGESQPALADLQGRGRLAMIFGDADGAVHAVDPVTRAELAGWPVHTDALAVTHAHAGIDAGHEPILAPVAVGDLDHTGTPWVVATALTGRVYVWGPDGSRRPGWPRTMDLGVVAPPVPRPAWDHTRVPARGATAGPVLFDLAGDHRLEVIQAGWDGALHVWRPDGSDLPGWPIRVQLPVGFSPDPGTRVIEDHKLDTPPAVGYLTPDHRPDLVIGSQYTEITGNGLSPLGTAFLHAYGPDGHPLPGWPVKLRSTVEYYGSAQEFITEALDAPVAADVDGTGPGTDQVVGNPVLSPAYRFRGDGTLVGGYGPAPDPLLGLLSGAAAGPAGLLGALGANLPTDFPVAFTTSGAFGRFGAGGALAYAEPGSGGISTAVALLAPGRGYAIKNFEQVYAAGSGTPLPGFPSLLQGLDFLGSPIVADVTGSGQPSIVNAADSGLLQAFDAGGGEAAGFPKAQPGWIVYAPSAGDLLSDGRTDLVAVSREGYLLAWSTPGRAAGNREWWTARHDEWRTGRYGVDTRPPGVPRSVSWAPGRLQLSFVAPGDDWYDGTTAAYLVRFDGGPARRVASHGAAGTTMSLLVPPGTRRVSIQALDAAGNLGQAVSVGS